jgi:hypothetical protein
VSGGGLYPSYKDLDALLDIERLRGLDCYVRERLERRLSAERDLQFYTGPFTLQGDAPKLPGSRMVYLASSSLPENYYDLDRTSLWRRSAAAEEFSELMDFIDTLPFAATARMLIMYDPEGRAVTAHRDHDSIDVCHEFIWFRTNRAKPFYMLDPPSGERSYVAGYSAWFDTVNQYHGGDASGELAWSIRVDGRFTDEFRAMMPMPSRNPASRPALWAAQEPSPRRQAAVERTA